MTFFDDDSDYYDPVADELRYERDAERRHQARLLRHPDPRDPDFEDDNDE